MAVYGSGPKRALGNEPMIVARADELMRPNSRRDFVRTLCAGGTVLMLPTVFSACSSDDPPTAPNPPAPVSGVSFDLRSDIGIFRLVHALEQLEGAFYTAVVASGSFSSFFSADERELLTDLRDVEIIHREFVRTALGSQALPDLSGSINTATFNSLLSSRANILNAARLFEHIGVAGLNGAGKYIQDSRNLLIAGKLASVEARHAAALRDISQPAGVNANTAFAGDDIVNDMGLDVKLEAGAVVSRVAGTNLLMSNTLANPAISNGPTTAQGTASADFFPTTP